MIEKSIIVFVPKNDLFPFASRVPSTPERNVRIERFLHARGRNELSFTLQQGGKVTAINDTAWGNLDSRKGGKSGIPVHGAGNGG